MCVPLGLNLLWPFSQGLWAGGEDQEGSSPSGYPEEGAAAPGPARGTLTLARAVLMFSMFSMLLTQLLGTLLQARRM